ncbi:MAG TPA: LTA synthase family protein [Chitinophagaceae bacterium]|nr:LTA synthase family protein [Chitinophagaceae bacterium]
MRYDLREICIILLFLLLIGSIKFFNPFISAVSKKVVTAIWWAVLISFFFFYAVDFAHFHYLTQRLNASVLNYLDDKDITFKMVWQSYPVLKIFAGIIVVTVILIWVIEKLYCRAARSSPEIKKSNRIAWAIFAGILFATAIFGRVGQFPLRWSDAFSMGNDFEADVALNPFQSFFSTITFRRSVYSVANTRKYYPLMATQTQVTHPDPKKLNFDRFYTGMQNLHRPNVVLVICESFSAYKSSMWGNPLNTTPYFAQICKRGVFFNRCFTPAYGTARGVWAVVTGIPDVEIPKTASRNPAMVDQDTILNDFKDYQKMYFIGGSASWANIRGLLKDNINGLKLYEQPDYKAPKLNVWGISDKNLFLESNEILARQTSPFFAIIQTAGNHRPYTIPDEDLAEFKRVSLPTDTLKKYGFENDAELNAFRYTDFCFEKFMEAAQKEAYFNNTIFVFVGDHGIRGDAGDMFPRAWTDQGLTCEHVPLVFYCPAKLKPQIIPVVASQIDILPSVASLANISYTNSTLGRNLFDSSTLANPADPKNCAFIIDHDVRQIGIVNNEYYLFRSLVSGKEEVVSVVNNKLISKSPRETNKIYSLRRLMDGYFETARYMLFNNKKKKAL